MDKSHVKTVERALKLEREIEKRKGILSTLESQQFHEAPKPPAIKYPDIVPDVRFNWVIAAGPFFALFIPAIVTGSTILLLLFGLLCIPLLVWPIAYYFAFHRKKRDAAIEKIRSSAHYKERCAELDKRFAEMKEEYETEPLAKYKKELSEFAAKKEAAISEAKSALSSLETELKNLYDTTRLIPPQYRYIPALEHIYGTVSTTGYDIKTALAMYDRHEQRMLEEERLNAQVRAERLAQENYERSQQPSGGGLLSHALDIGKIAVGSKIGTYGMRKELRAQTDLMREQAKQAERDRRQADNDRFRANANARQLRAQVLKENQERQRKGLPLKPVPPERVY